MRYTVLGAQGFIGRHMVDWLNHEGYEVHAPVRGQSLRTSHSLGHVIYAIGLTANFRTRPFETVDAHVSVLKDVLQHAEFDSLVYLSSTRVYAGAGRGGEDQILSVDVQCPDDYYNLSKLMGEALCLHSDRQNTRIARISNVVGPGKGHSEDFLYSLVRDARTGHIHLRSDPSSAKDYIAVHDLPPLLARLSQPCLHRIYNLASGHQINHQSWLDGLSSRTGCTVSYQEDAPLQTFPVIQVDRIQAEFGFRAGNALELLDQLLDETRH
jgi:nucleoside-diphosphate-sugar epimerase